MYVQIFLRKNVWLKLAKRGVASILIKLVCDKHRRHFGDWSRQCAPGHSHSRVPPPASRPNSLRQSGCDPTLSPHTLPTPLPFRPLPKISPPPQAKIPLLLRFSRPQNFSGFLAPTLPTGASPRRTPELPPSAAVPSYSLPPPPA